MVALAETIFWGFVLYGGIFLIGMLLWLLFLRAMAEPPAPDMTQWTHEQRMEYFAQQQVEATRAAARAVIWTKKRDAP